MLQCVLSLRAALPKPLPEIYDFLPLPLLEGHVYCSRQWTTEEDRTGVRVCAFVYVCDMLSKTWLFHIKFGQFLNFKYVLMYVYIQIYAFLKTVCNSFKACIDNSYLCTFFHRFFMFNYISIYLHMYMCMQLYMCIVCSYVCMYILACTAHL